MRWDPQVEEYLEFADRDPEEAEFIATAMHEAGHAVMEFGLGNGIERVGARRVAQDGALGAMIAQPGEHRGPVHMMLTFIAGQMAASVGMNDSEGLYGRDGDELYQLVKLRIASCLVLASGEPTKRVDAADVPDALVTAYANKLDKLVWRIFARRRRPMRAVMAVTQWLVDVGDIEDDDTFCRIVTGTGFRRGSLMHLLASEEVRPDVPDPKGFLAMHNAEEAGLFAAWRQIAAKSNSSKD